VTDRLFERHVMVAWSAAARPTAGRNGTWIGSHADGSTRVEKVATRLEARTRLLAHATDALRAGERLLMGFDFPFGYPAGVAERVTGTADALALWRWLAARLEDGPDNSDNRFEVAAEINRLYPGAGPFRGRPADRKTHHETPDVPMTATARTGLHHPPERRHADRAVKGAKSVWQLGPAGSAGSRTLTGLPALLALREDPEIAPHARIWPFETGLATPEAPIVLAEIHPSLIPPDTTEPVRAAGRVRAVCDWLAGLDRDGVLAPLFAGPPGATPDERRRIATEEAWILGLEAPRLRPVQSATSAAPSASPGSPVVAASPVAAPSSVAAASAAPPANPVSAAYPAAAAAVPEALRYERDPAEIYRKSFEAIRSEARLDHLPEDLRDTAIRLVHACGMPDIATRLAWSEGVAERARRALATGAPVLCDAEAIAAMVARRRLPAANDVICALSAPETPVLARRLATTRSAAAVELWRDRIAGAIVAIGNAPTALFHLLERLDRGWPRPAAILGFPVGFIGAAEAKAELAANPRNTPFLTLHGRRGGSAMAAAAVNALAIESEAST